MNKAEKKFLNITSLLTIVLLLSSMSLNIHSNAMIEKNDYSYEMQSIDYSTWQWSDTEVLSTESLDLSMFSSMTIDSKGNVHVAWEDDTALSSGTDRDIFYKYWDIRTETWSTTEVVSTESSGDSVHPTLGIDAAENVHIAWVDYTDGGSGSDRDIFYKRYEGASGWIATEVVSSSLDGMAENPSLAVDSSNNVHVAWEDNSNVLSSGTDFDIFYKQLSGQTHIWVDVEVVSTESTEMSAFCSLAVDNLDNVHIAWYDGTDLDGAGTDADIFYKNKNSFTTLWSAVEVVSTESTGVSIVSDITMDSHGNVHIAWQDLSDYGELGSGYDIFYKKWDIYTQLWSTTMVLSPGSTAESQGAKLAVDSEDNVHLVWYDATNQIGAGTDNDVFYRNWNAYSDEWSSIRLVSTESTNHSTSPCLAVSDAGYVFVSWYDLTELDYCGADRDIFIKYFAGPPEASVLAYFDLNPTEVNLILLDWSDVTGASEYHIYHSTSFIFSIEGMDPEYSTTGSSYNYALVNEDYHYFVIVAENFVGNGSSSNCEYVEFAIPTLNEFALISGLILGIFTLLFVITRIRKKKSDVE